jgi:hypothetical protein
MKYKKTKKGLTAVIYSNQRQNSTTRNMSMPDYTLEELREWVYSQPLFHELYDLWVESGYDTWQTPSLDRLDDYLPYTLDNLQVMTWKENNAKSMVDIREGRNRKPVRAVEGYNEETDDYVEFYSVAQAARELNIGQSLIHRAAKGERNSAYGYYWQYLNN